MRALRDATRAAREALPVGAAVLGRGRGRGRRLTRAGRAGGEAEVGHGSWCSRARYARLRRLQGHGCTRAVTWRGDGDGRGDRRDPRRRQDRRRRARLGAARPGSRGVAARIGSGGGRVVATRSRLRATAGSRRGARRRRTRITARPEAGALGFSFTSTFSQENAFRLATRKARRHCT